MKKGLHILKKDWDCIELIWDVGAWDIRLENYTTKEVFYMGKELGETFKSLPKAISKTVEYLATSS